MSKLDYCVHGEWENEPDHEEFVWAELPCIVARVMRGPWGTLNGYVGVPPDHPAYPGKMVDVNSIHRLGLRDEANGGWIVPPRPNLPARMRDLSYNDLELDVHGGLTFAGEGDGYMGRREGFHWFGFDTANFMDYKPTIDLVVHEIEMKFASSHSDETYCNFEYVKNEVKKLAEQLAYMMQPPEWEKWKEQFRAATTMSDILE